QLMSESDCLLNLHDGSGFYRDTWQSSMKNPNRYGQSIIVDCENYTNPVNGNIIALGKMAREVIPKINKYIGNPDHFFHLNNHRTKESNSLHPEQRKSATYYALYECGIPAFGVETSKSLPLNPRIYHHNLAVNAFMEVFSIIPEIPGIGLEPPQVKYVVVKVNDNSPVVVANGETLHIYPKDTIKIISVEGNYDRGFSADIVGYGSVNDVNKPFSLTGPTRILIRKDHLLCGEFNVAFSKKPHYDHSVTVNPGVNFFKIRINGKEIYYPNGSHVDIVSGDLVELIEIDTGPVTLAGVVCNFKGFVGNSRFNTGEDRGYVINTATDLWKRYSLYKKGRAYQVIVSRNDKDIIGRLFFDIEPALFEYILLDFNGNDKKWVSNGESIKLKLNDSVKIVDIKSNVVPSRLTAVIKSKNVSIPIRVGEQISGTKIASLLEGNFSGCCISISRDESPIALMPVTIVDYVCKNPLTGEMRRTGD
ncbi:MAG: M99 family carboxypeptidase catalytic domain-containing protein, partial [Thermodesulfobacteriota bacterium]|nr:M99 family carboxypeptidase catalytic domain-containing protein [Thermodesulfobacteriota bacterium]